MEGLMPLVTDGVIIAALGGVFAVVSTMINRKSSREDAVLDLVAKRLDSAERRLDSLETSLDRERERSASFRRLANDLATWAHHAWVAIRRHDPGYPPPPGPPRESEERDTARLDPEFRI